MNQFPINSLYSRSSGTSSTSPFVEFFSDVDPTIYDVNFPIQKRWFNVVSGVEFILVSFSSPGGALLANWYQINSSGGGGVLTWLEVSVATQMIVNYGYITSGIVSYTLPLTAELGDSIKVVGKSGISTILQNAGQQIVIGKKSTTVGVTGQLDATFATDCLELICTTGGISTVFTVDDSMGNWTVT